MNLFRWKDFLTFGLLGLASTIASIYVTTNLSTETPNRAEAIGLMWVVTVLFWLGYIAILVMRNKFLNSITFTTAHNIYVIAGDFKVNKSDIEKETSETIIKWKTATNWYGCERSARQGLYLFIKPYPVQAHASLGKVAGYTVGKHMIIGYKPEEHISKTAYAHELGHVIHREWTGEINEKAAHDFMKNNKLR